MSEIKGIVVKAEVSYTYSPREYLDYCEEYNLEPTQDGFEDYIADSYLDEDFINNGLTITNITRYDTNDAYCKKGV